MQRVVDLQRRRSARAVNATALEESFTAWHRQVATNKRVARIIRPITCEELTAVSIATVRESRTHRHWPREVVEKFLAADTARSPAPYTSPKKLENIIRWPLYYLAKGG